MDKEKNKLKNFLKKVREKFGPAEIIMFGSRATGNFWKRSDYDFIIISEKFEGVHWLERISAIVRLWVLPVDIDVLPYTPSEFAWKLKTSSVVRSAMSHKKVL